MVLGRRCKTNSQAQTKRKEKIEISNEPFRAIQIVVSSNPEAALKARTSSVIKMTIFNVPDMNAVQFGIEKPTAESLRQNK